METVIVLDIEGTVCPISFVHEVLFPFALRKAQQEIPLIKFPLDSGRSELEAYLSSFPDQYTKNSQILIDHIEHLVQNDVKATYLKSLQGYLWKSGYESGEIKAPIYTDAVEAIKTWSKSTKVYIYSSGSVSAQKLLFSHADVGDLTPYFSGYYDTVNAGSKLIPSSYEKIASEVNSNKVMFYSDNPKEIDAATAAGWETTFVIRPGNPEYPDYKWPGKRAFKLPE